MVRPHEQRGSHSRLLAGFCCNKIAAIPPGESRVSIRISEDGSKLSHRGPLVILCKAFLTASVALLAHGLESDPSSSRIGSVTSAKLGMYSR